MSDNNEEFEFSFNPDNVAEAKHVHHHHHHHRHHHSDGSGEDGRHHSTQKVSSKKKKKVSISRIVDQHLPGQKIKVDLDGKKKNTSKARKTVIVVLIVVIAVLSVVALILYMQNIFHRHDYGEWTIDIEPSCTEAGYEVSTCRICGEKQYREVAPTHKLVEKSYDEESGTYTYVCEICGLQETSVSKK